MKFWEKCKIDLIVDSREEYKEAVLSLLRRDENAKLLDLGCGDGKLTKRIADKIGPRAVYGIDLNLSEMEGAEIRMGDLDEEFPFADTFDVVVASQIIEHLHNTDGFLKEIYEVLKPKGYAIISTPNLASWHNVLYLILGRQPETATVSDELYPWKEKPGHRRVFTATELTKLLAFHGFMVERLVGTGYPPFKGKLASWLSKLDWKHAGTITVKVRKGKQNE